MTNYITATELASYAPDLDTSAFDAPTVSGIISRASRKIDQYCNVKGFDLASETSERDRAAINSMGELIINVRRRPILNYNSASPSVSAIRLVKGQFSVTLSLSGNAGIYYQINYPGNLIHYPSQYLAGVGTLMLAGSSQLLTLAGANVFYEVDYTGGYQAIPDDLKEATTLMVRDVLQARNNPSGTTSLHQGSLSMTFGTTDNRSPFANAAMYILNSGDYVRRSMF